MPTAFITGCDRGLGLSLTATFARHGWCVFAGSYLPEWHLLTDLSARYSGQIYVVPLDIASGASVQDAVAIVRENTDAVDAMVNNAAVSSPLNEQHLRSGLDYDDILRLYEVNTLGALHMTQALFPLLEKGDGKRLCYVSSEAGSVTRSARTAWYGYCMSKAALNQGVRHLFTALRPSGYTFRLFHPGWMRTYMSGTRNEKAELEPDDVAAIAYEYFVSPQEENRLVMRDWQGKEWDW